nr:DNA-directed RNA polymerase III subunit 2-like isoform X1 [Ziziphus jujuba var. spinosa]
MCPDLSINPQGKMIELLVGRAEVSCGRFRYGSAFGEPSGHADTVEAIVKHSWRRGLATMARISFIQQHVFLFSPPSITGCPLQAYIFKGPIYYQTLKHMVIFPLLCSYHRLSTTGIYLHGTNLLPEAKAHGAEVLEAAASTLWPQVLLCIFELNHPH